MLERIYDLHAFAQQARFDRGMMSFRWGVTGVGLAILLGAVAVAFSKPKDPKKKLSPAVKAIAGISLAALGVGVIAYAWLGI